MTRPGPLDRLPPPVRPWVFAVEDTSVQVTWRTLPPGPVRVTAADSEVEVVSDGGPGSVVLGDLPPGTALDLRIAADGLPRSWRHHRFTTLVPPPGEEVGRFATISDMHIGEYAFGIRGSLLERPVPDEAHPIRATRAALRELEAWGAERVVVKGDLTHNGRAKDWLQVGRLLAEPSIPVDIMPGNHDYYGAAGEPVADLALHPLGLATTSRVRSVATAGLNLVLVNTTIAGRRAGAVRHVHDEVIDRLRAEPGPAFVALHHHGERQHLPWFLPRGIPRSEMDRLLGAIAVVRPATFLSSGHTHRHRRRHVGPLVLTEVGSTKDFPGSWAGYVVHEGGIRQVVRRVTEPDLLRWTDHSASAAFGA